MARIIVTAGGQEITLAPLKSSQVAAFLDRNNVGASQEETVATSLRVIAQSIVQAKDPFAQDLTLEQVIEKVDDEFSWKGVNEGFLKVLDVTELRKAEPGEAPAAADSTSSESTSASQATPDGPSSA
jgi:hypothetical protein